MRNVWIFISSLAIVVAIGGAVYYLFPRAETNARSSSRIPDVSRPESQVFVVPAGNPLLTADAHQLRIWIPSYPIRCGEIVFEQADQKARNFSFCIAEIKRRIASHTKQEMRREDIFDPRVKAHWHDVMKGP